MVSNFTVQVYSIEKLAYLGKLSSRKVDEMRRSIFVIFLCVFVERTLCGDGL
jgi:hypothetical protein